MRNEIIFSLGLIFLGIIIVMIILISDANKKDSTFIFCVGGLGSLLILCVGLSASNYIKNSNLKDYHICKNQLTTILKTNVLIESQVEIIYENNYHCNDNNYRANVLCLQVVQKIIKNINPSCLELDLFKYDNQGIIDIMVQAKYHLN